MIAAGALAAMNRGKVDQDGVAMKLWMLGLDVSSHGSLSLLNGYLRSCALQSGFPLVSRMECHLILPT